MKKINWLVMAFVSSFVGCSSNAVKSPSSPHYNKAALIDSIGGAKIREIDGVPFKKIGVIIEPSEYLDPGEHHVTVTLQYEIGYVLV